MSDMNPPVLVTRDARGVLIIELNRPAVRNALLPDMLGDMADALSESVGDPAVRVIVLSGAGASFCAGGDAKAAPSEFPAAWTGLTRLLLGLSQCPKPVVARVQGHAVGFGCSLALAADLVVAETTTRFHWPFVHMGLVPEGTQLAVRCMPAAMLRSFALLGDPLTGAALAEAGVIHAAVESDRLTSTVDGLVDRLITLPAFGLAAIKRSLEAARCLPLPESLQWEGEQQQAIRSSPEFSAFRAAYFARAGVKVRDGR
ncbi:MAG: hypothetical protein RLZZ163_142 [Actinomycetota bacterium]